MENTTKRRIERLIRTATLIVGALIAGALPAAPHLEAQMRSTMAAPFDIPLSVTGGRYIVNVQVNGKGPFPFILDTGTSGIALDDGLAKELGLTKTSDRMEHMPNGADMKLDVYGVDSLRLGGVNSAGLGLTNVAADVISLPPVLGARGILGLPAFHDVLLTMDYTQNTARVSNGSLAAGQPGVIAYEESEGIIGVHATVAGKPLLFHLDSGNPGGIGVPKTFADSLPARTSLVEIGAVMTMGGRAKLYRMQLDGAFELGKIRLVDPVMTAQDPSGYGTGNIGQEFLHGYVLSIDQRHHLIALVPGAPK